MTLRAPRYSAKCENRGTSCPVNPLVRYTRDHGPEDLTRISRAASYPRALAFRRRLLGEIACVAARTLTTAIRTLTGERDLAVGIVARLQTHGPRATWHPHLHPLVTDGGFRPEGTFVSWPVHDTGRYAEAFLRAVLRLFLRLEHFDEDQAAVILKY